MTHLLTLYFLDSGAYSKGYLDWFGLHPTEYDWIHTDQINWFLQESGLCTAVYTSTIPDLTIHSARRYQANRETVYARRREGLWRHVATSSYRTSDSARSSARQT